MTRLRQSSPKVLTLLILLFSISPTYLPGYSSVRPCLTLIPIFYWAVYRPYDFSIISAFVTGLMLDMLDGTPLGINTLVITLFYLATDTQRRFLCGRSFPFVWFGFSLMAFGSMFVKWLFVSINYGAFTKIGLAFESFLLLLLSYPAFAWVCTKLHLYLSDKENDHA